MKYMTHNEIRKMWFDFFESKGHKIIESASLIPVNDNSLLWINAGVSPLKKYFDGTEVPENKRLVNIQKCIRTNDIENVGITKRHQTFFEMMGNFSIGDYFKEEAIDFAFELLTSKNWFNIPKEKLYITVYTHDSQTYNKWNLLGISHDHLIKLDENFWEIGAGPCGPDSEIFYDRGEKYDPDHTALEKFKRDEDQERYIEIWNNVFSQYNQEPGKTREEYKELPHKNIDTGAGLERWCLIFQDKDSNFETDLFENIIQTICNLTGITYNGQTPIKIIADHVRTLTFALSDGAFFENTGRGYVLRRLLRRSERLGRKLGLTEPFMYKLVSSVVETMKEAYPYLLEEKGKVEVLILDEEKLFLKTLSEGERILNDLIKNSTDGTISGSDAFKLYDTYGFPFELTEEYLHEHGYTTSREEFEKYMNSQKELAKKAAKTKASMASQKKVLLDFTEESTFVYGIYRLKTNVLAIFTKDTTVKKLDRDCYIALKRTCCYAESGGQVSDTGMIIGKNFKARVLDVFKAPNGQHIHKVKLLDGIIEEDAECEVVLDRERRKNIEENHSSVHLLHYALRTILEGDVHQAGSYVDDKRLRLDFTYSKKLTADKVIEVEKLVNKLIAEKSIVSTEIMPLDKAKKLGAMALFSEKYSSIVRVVKMGKSIELCGGTHTNNTANIKKFAIFSYESKGSNTYRIEACTDTAIDKTLYSIIEPYNNETIKLLMKAKNILEETKKEGITLSFDINIEQIKTDSYEDIVYHQNQLSYVQSEVKALESAYLKAKEKKILNNLDEYRQNIKTYNKIQGLIMEVDNMDNALIKTIADTLVNEITPGCVFFINKRNDGSLNFICRSNCHVNAGLVVKDASISSNGNGGGSATFAQGGGKTQSKLDAIKEHLEKVFNDEQ